MTEVGDKILLEQLVVGATNVLTDRVHEVHEGQHLVRLDLLDPLLDNFGNNGGMLDLLLGDLCEGVDDDFVVECERGQCFPVLLRDLFAEAHQVHCCGD